jgi:hypothetical protein
MVHEYVPTATKHAFQSHPRRVFSISYLLTGFFHCDGTISILPLAASYYVHRASADTFAAHSGGTPQKSQCPQAVDDPLELSVVDPAND